MSHLQPADRPAPHAAAQLTSAVAPAEAQP